MNSGGTARDRASAASPAPLVMRGRITQINISQGGVPKRPVPAAEVTPDGLSGDRHNDTRHHGGPERAVCLFSREVIDRLRAEGHPITPGSCGENLTIEGIDWSLVTPGVRFEFDGGVVLEVASYSNPCATIRDSFTGLAFQRIRQDLHPGESRVYARVVKGGTLKPGERLSVLVSLEA